jgi:hypothetical protein
MVMGPRTARVPLTRGKDEGSSVQIEMTRSAQGLGINTHRAAYRGAAIGWDGGCSLIAYRIGGRLQRIMRCGSARLGGYQRATFIS